MAKDLQSIMDQYVKAWNTGDVDLLDEVCHPDFRFVTISLADVKGLAEFKQFLTEFRKSVPDYFLEVEDRIVEGDKYAAKWTWRGTHSGESAIQLVPPTGAKLTVPGCSIIYLEEGRLFQELAYPDNLGFLTQLGLIPSFTAAEQG